MPPLPVLATAAALGALACPIVALCPTAQWLAPSAGAIALPRASPPAASFAARLCGRRRGAAICVRGGGSGGTPTSRRPATAKSGGSDDTARFLANRASSCCLAARGGGDGGGESARLTTALIVALWYAASIVANQSAKALVGAIGAEALTLAQFVLASGCGAFVLACGADGVAAAASPAKGRGVARLLGFDSRAQLVDTAQLAAAFLAGCYTLNAYVLSWSCRCFCCPRTSRRVALTCTDVGDRFIIPVSSFPVTRPRAACDDAEFSQPPNAANSHTSALFFSDSERNPNADPPAASLRCTSRSR